MPEQPSPPLYDTLKNKTYFGLLIAEFLAAFNDQCIHASAMFFAIHKGALTESQAISLMPILFYSPWAVFCTLSAYCADRYSKRSSLIFWKVAEVGITALALLGFCIGATSDSTMGHAIGAFTVMACVFLMGTHSAFYVPNKYGVLPEIFQPSMLSRANGFVESTSFLAVILGTATGGALSFVFFGREYYIGIILVILALIGTLSSLFIRRMAPADPGRPMPSLIPWNLYKPLISYLGMIFRSRPLALAVSGIGFFTFIVAFMRATMYMHGQSQIPEWDEFRTSMTVAVVALGVGLGSPLAGFLSGGKVELGLIPLGAFGMILVGIVASVFLHFQPVLLACLVLMGFSAGFYIVPLYTLLQHRAPRGSKGSSIASSNAVNVTGAIAASLVFFALDWSARRFDLVSEVPQSQEPYIGKLTKKEISDKTHRILSFEVITDTGIPIRVKQDERLLPPTVVADFDIWSYVDEQLAWSLGERDDAPSLEDLRGNIVKVDEDVRVDDAVRVLMYDLDKGRLHRYHVIRADKPIPVFYNKENLPRFLFLGASVMMLLSIILVSRRLPDIFVRSMLWLRSTGRYHVKVVGIHNLPTNEPAILATNCHQFEDSMHVLASTDRPVRFLLSEYEHDAGKPLLRFMAKNSGMVVLPPDSTPQQRQNALAAGRKSLQSDLVALSADDVAPQHIANADFELLLDGLRLGKAVPIVPVYCGAMAPGTAERPAKKRIQVVIGHALPPDTPPAIIRMAINRLGNWVEDSAHAGETLVSVKIPAASSASSAATVATPPPPP
jgi:MFS family permease/1-acyl-sn-glycerol-3-phosphate acyltransferase